VWRADGSQTEFSDESVTQVTTSEICSRAIGMMTVYYLRDKNPMWKQAAEQMIKRLSELAIYKEDNCYLTGAWEPNAKVNANVEMPTDFWAEEWGSRLIQDLSQYYKHTGYEPAREFAGRLTRYFRFQGPYFDPQGRPLIGEQLKREYPSYGNMPGTIGGHSQTHALALLCLLEYATAVNDRDTLEFVKASYEWVKREGPALYGVSTLVGWFPEVYRPEYLTNESETGGILLSVGTKLTEAGAGDYWDDVDRWLRNHFAEAQLTSVDWVYRLAEQQPRKPVASYGPKAGWTSAETAEHAAERNIGAFAGWSTGNEWGQGIMHCCTGNNARALYYVWVHMLNYKNGQLRLNLLLNRASQWVDVHSYIPYEGRVDLKMKEPCESVRVRAPEWIKSESKEMIGTVNGSPRPLHWEGRYVNLGEAKPGDVFAVMFPIGERTVKEMIGPARYTLVIKGSTVVSIDPPGKNGALYQGREKYRNQQAQWRKSGRFVTEEDIRW
jgi:hypothetical protein